MKTWRLSMLPIGLVAFFSLNAANEALPKTFRLPKLGDQFIAKFI